MKYPNKPAITKYPINDLIRNRWSPMLFANQPIAIEKLLSCFEAARWAQSSYNEQPWRFIYALADDAENFNKLAGLLNLGNSWAEKAAVLILVMAKKNFSHNHKSNYHAMYDTGAATSNLFLEAVHQGLVGHVMGGFDKEKALAIFNIPAEEFQAAAMMALGYPASQAELNKESQDFIIKELAERTRLDLEQIVFKGQWLNK